MRFPAQDTTRIQETACHAGTVVRLAAAVKRGSKRQATAAHDMAMEFEVQWEGGLPATPQEVRDAFTVHTAGRRAGAPPRLVPRTRLQSAATRDGGSDCQAPTGRERRPKSLAARTTEFATATAVSEPTSPGFTLIRNNMAASFARSRSCP